ncbi:undecaprenyl phosphate 4-deoxy-4-formamido-L-arabinose transferase [Rikenella microfusus]|uniref:Undecaprenyl phosphate 4-deoxy-4-formamido-L-arabinose transferase n=1 Tax=Rikenella microfusus TaxID=28139 RepID=A0A379MUG7_9BACT|nr:undecaprenyl phosphate 4-deoxy-4-formamido-L-arabinose transferase [Rikenella microfusus]
MVKSIEVYGEMHRFIPILAKQAGFRRIGEKVVQHRARQFGVSKFGWERMIKGYIDLLTVLFMTRFGRRPMYIFGGIGTLMFLVGAVITVYLISEKLYLQHHGLPLRPVTDQPLFYIALLAVGWAYRPFWPASWERCQSFGAGTQPVSGGRTAVTIVCKAAFRTAVVFSLR